MFEYGFVVDLSDDAVHEVEGAESFGKIDGATDFDGGGDGFGFGVVAVVFVVECVFGILVPVAGVPADTAFGVESVEGVGAFGLYNGEARDAVDKLEFLEFHKGLAECGAVAEVATGDDDPVGGNPVTGFEDSVHD